MYPPINETPNSSDLHLENELIQLKMELERGAAFYKSPDFDLSPEVESQWLKSIQEFEHLNDESEQVTVYEYCGKPAFRKMDALEPGELPEALAHLYDLFTANQITFDTLCLVDDTELYRFITEELFAVKMDNMRMPGMRYCFTYEEFHPNAEYDIKSACCDFIKAVVRNDFPETNMFMWMTEQFHTADGLLPEAEAFERLRQSHKRFHSLELNMVENASVVIQNCEALAVYNVNYSGKDSTGGICFSGQAKFGLEGNGDYWHINRFELPGFEF